MTKMLDFLAQLATGGGPTTTAMPTNGNCGTNANEASMNGGGRDDTTMANANRSSSGSGDREVCGSNNKAGGSGRGSQAN